MQRLDLEIAPTPSIPPIEEGRFCASVDIDVFLTFCDASATYKLLQNDHQSAVILRPYHPFCFHLVNSLWMC
jgi:hypothetical protein